MIFSNRKKQPSGEVDLTRLPRHIAVIMDGNGRWAAKRALPRGAGHAAGAETFRRVATYCKDLGIDYLTAYAFSTENWKRPAQEVDGILNLLDKYLRESIESMERDHIRMRFLGDCSALPEKLRAFIARTDEISARYTGFQANICVNYGGRDEIVRAANLAAAAGEVTKENLEAHLWSAGIPDPDLIIRPSGELRLSNFLLWQSAYTELYFTDTLWPDFGPKEMELAILDYQRRNRRFGEIS
ncbi:MAG: polyprenyl diphosphate synthase [Firmicutes bacterium]|nr:polyprenyl diphosphate synthase [Bacillota bacterium]